MRGMQGLGELYEGARKMCLDAVEMVNDAERFSKDSEQFAREAEKRGREFVGETVTYRIHAKSFMERIRLAWRVLFTGTATIRFRTRNTTCAKD